MRNATVAADDRFDKQKTKWTFYLIGNTVDEFVEKKRNQNLLPKGMIYSGEVDIWVKTWGEIINDARWRYEFFREKLEFEVSHDEALKSLKEKYSEYLPPDSSEMASSSTA